MSRITVQMTRPPAKLISVPGDFWENSGGYLTIYKDRVPTFEASPGSWSCIFKGDFGDISIKSDEDSDKEDT